MNRHKLGGGLDGIYQESDLKICDLCGALNLAENGECFICGWHGHFDTRTEIVRIAMDLAKRRSGDMSAGYLTDEDIFALRAGQGFGARFSRLLGRIRHWLFG